MGEDFDYWGLDPDDPRHGVGTNLYTNHGCRCQPCRTAWTRYCQQRKFERKIMLELDPTIVPHGKASTYGNWMCRCRPCTDAWTTDIRERNLRNRDKR
jgi:hypothetical protein